MFASSFLAAIASMIACRLVPLPEISTPIGTGFAISFLSGADRCTPRTATYFADHKTLFTDARDRVHHGIGLSFAYDEDHAQSIIESAIHFGLGNAADLLNQLEDRRHRPALTFDDGAPAVR